MSKTPFALYVRRVKPPFVDSYKSKKTDEVGTASLLSRASAGLVGGSAVFCIPGSPKAVKLACEEIIVREIRHILTHAGQ